MRTRRQLVFAAFVVIVSIGLWAAASQENEPKKKRSPAYTITVALQVKSPFVADGRMTFADFAFRATFGNVVFVLDPYEGAGLMKQSDGRLLLTRHVFNDVDMGGGRHQPWVEKPWPKEFPASLVEGWVEREEEEDYEADEEGSDEWEDNFDETRYLPKTIGLGFQARFGQLEWFSKPGSRMLMDMRFEFAVAWKPLFVGKPVSLKLPYEGDYPEDKGEWRIEFIPQKKSR